MFAHWRIASRATRYRVFNQFDGVDTILININTVTFSPI